MSFGQADNFSAPICNDVSIFLQCNFERVNGFIYNQTFWGCFVFVTNKKKKFYKILFVMFEYKCHLIMLIILNLIKQQINIFLPISS